MDEDIPIQSIDLFLNIWLENIYFIQYKSEHVFMI